jgi:hypothetical protein
VPLAGRTAGSPKKTSPSAPAALFGLPSRQPPQPPCARTGRPLLASHAIGPLSLNIGRAPHPSSMVSRPSRPGTFTMPRPPAGEQWGFAQRPLSRSQGQPRRALTDRNAGPSGCCRPPRVRTSVRCRSWFGRAWQAQGRGTERSHRSSDSDGEGARRPTRGLTTKAQRAAGMFQYLRRRARAFGAPAAVSFGRPFNFVRRPLLATGKWRCPQTAAHLEGQCPASTSVIVTAPSCQTGSRAICCSSPPPAAPCPSLTI